MGMNNTDHRSTVQFHTDEIRRLEGEWTLVKLVDGGAHLALCILRDISYHRTAIDFYNLVW